MRETKFIEQKKARWQEFETILEFHDKDPEKLSDLFVQLTDDLSYARTFYPNRSVRVYLNTLTGRVFNDLYQTRRFRLATIRTFFVEDFPDMMWHGRGAVAVAFGLFWLAFIVGWVSTIYDPHFCEIILGKSYVEMTRENIAKGDPLGVYKQGSSFDAFIRITQNNLTVDLIAFSAGILGSIGAAAMVFSNGVLFGSFQAFFWDEGVFRTSFFGIWVHGSLEWWTVVLSGAAGIVLGWGILSPGTYTRLQAFQISARRAVAMLAAAMGVTVLAGFNESFLTRHTEVPEVLRGGLIFAAFFFVVFYFLLYPYLRYRRGLVKPFAEPELAPDKAQSLVWSSIKANGDVLKEAFAEYQKHLAAVLRWVVVATALYLVAAACCFGRGFVDQMTRSGRTSGYSYNLLVYVFGKPYTQFMVYIVSKSVFFPISTTLLFAALTLWLQFLVAKTYALHPPERTFTQFVFERGRWAMTTFLLGVLAFTSWWLGSSMPFTILLPVVQFILAGNIREDSTLRETVGVTFGGPFLQIVGYYLLCLVLWGFFSLITASQLTDYAFATIRQLLPYSGKSAAEVVFYLRAGLFIFLLQAYTPLLVFGSVILYGSFYEAAFAASLYERVQSLGASRSLRGLQREAVAAMPT